MNYYDNREECVERRIDSDLSYACEAMGGNSNGFRLEDVAYVLAYLQGENDGPSFYWIVAMKDRTYAFVSGWCDYTGWGCQDGGEAHIFVSLREALTKAYEVNVEVRKLLTLQLTGERSFGEATPSNY
jgi:hypothetical protein